MIFVLHSAFVGYEEFCRSRKKHLCTVWGYPKFGNIFARFGSIRNSGTSLQDLPVSEIRKHLCTVWGYPKFDKHLCTVCGYPKFGNIFALFGGIRNSETSLQSLGVYEIRKLFFSLFGCFQISGETFDLSSIIFCLGVIREFLLLVFILNLRFRENKENSILCKGGFF